MSRKKMAIALTLAALSGLGHAQVDLARAYSIARPALCALLNRPANCPLPKDIVLGVSYSSVRDAIARSREVLAVGSAAGLPEVFWRDLAARVSSAGDYTVYWASLPGDVEFVKRWAQKARPSSGGFKLYTFAVPDVEAARTATRVPFLAIGDQVYFYLPSGWFRLEGEFVRQIYGAVRGAATHLAAAADREAQVGAKLEEAREGVLGR